MINPTDGSYFPQFTGVRIKVRWDAQNYEVRCRVWPWINSDFRACFLPLYYATDLFEVTYRPQWLKQWRICLLCRRLGSILGLGRTPGEGNGNRLQYSCLENPIDRGAWQATVHGVAESQTTHKPTIWSIAAVLMFWAPWLSPAYVKLQT